jgi:hypothetical protein
MDTSFTGDGLVQITGISLSSDILTSSSYIYYSYNSSSNNKSITQNWRIIRRVPKDNYVVIKNLPSYTDSGLLIPQNFNPNYDPYTLARKAGLIQ